MKKMEKPRFLTLFEFLVIMTIALFQMESVCAQTDKQEGKIITGSLVTKGNDPIVGASVIVKGTTRGTFTDFDGNFSIRAFKGDILIISFVGFANEEITVGEKDYLKIFLSQDSGELVYWCCTSHSELPHCSQDKSELESAHSKDEVYTIKGP